MEHIDARRALELLIDVVDQYGEDTIYQRISVGGDSDWMEGQACRYEYQGEPSCLVGHVLHRAGVPISKLKKLDEPIVSAGKLHEWEDLDVTSEASRLLHVAQNIQDLGKSWGEALSLTQARYEKMMAEKEEA